MKLFGKKAVSFISKDGTPIEGLTIYFGTPIDAKGCGYAIDKAFISSKHPDFDTLNHTECGDEFEIYYNKFGRIEKLDFFPSI